MGLRGIGLVGRRRRLRLVGDRSSRRLQLLHREVRAADHGDAAAAVLDGASVGVVTAASTPNIDPPVVIVAASAVIAPAAVAAVAAASDTAACLLALIEILLVRF